VAELEEDIGELQRICDERQVVMDGLKQAADERLALVEKLHAAAAERLEVITRWKRGWRQGAQRPMIVWLASYPRSGNTLLRTILKRCLDLDSYADEPIHVESPVRSDNALVGHRELPDPGGFPRAGAVVRRACLREDAPSAARRCAVHLRRARRRPGGEELREITTSTTCRAIR
jgi:hypothetical protein